MGRSLSNCISFATDKSISRVHAEVRLDAKSGSLHLVDLKSRYGTYLRSSSGASGTTAAAATSNDDFMQLSANDPLAITPDAIVRFGTGDAKVRFLRRHFVFCTTRLDKADRDLLKKRAKAIGAKLVEEVQLATHIVSNKAAATVKTLSAIVSNKPIVNMNWLDFVDTESSCEMIPLEADCPPSTLDDFKIVSIMDSRSGVLMNRSVFLTDPIDEQYVGIVEGCGGRLVRLYPSASNVTGNTPAVQLRTRKSAAVQQKTSATAAHDIVAQLRSCLSDIATTLPPVVFFDETGSGDRCTLPDPFMQLLQESSAEWLTVGQLAAAVLSCKPPVLASHPPSMQQQQIGGTGQLQATRPKLAYSQLLPSVEPPALPSDVTGVVIPTPSTAAAAVVDIVKEQQLLNGSIDPEVVKEANRPSAGTEAELAGDSTLMLMVESKRMGASETEGKSAPTVLVENRSASVSKNDNSSVSAEGWSESDRINKKPRLRIDSSDDDVTGGRNQLAAANSSAPPPPLQPPSSQQELSHVDEKILQLAVPGQVSTSCYYESDSIRRMASASTDDIGDTSSIRNVKRFTKNAVSVATAFDTMRFRKFDFVLPKETDREIQVRHGIRLML